MSGAVDEQTKGSEDDGVREELALLEAALYVAGRPLNLKTLGSIIRTRSKRKLQRLARILMEEYNRRNTALEVLELEDQRFVLQLKTKYSPRVKRLAVRPLLTDGPLKTLAYVAYMQPVTQKQVIDVRGTHVYSHIRQLRDMDLISSEKSGKTWLLRTTEYFADYFGLSHNPGKMKRQFRRILDDVTKKQTSTSKERRRLR